MKYKSLGEFLNEAKARFAKGPVALIFAEHAVEVDSTLRHHLKTGFGHVVLLADDAIPNAADLNDKISRISYDVRAEGAVPAAAFPARPAGGASGDCVMRDSLS